MRHCVATYAPRCAFGGSSIWSMTVEEERGRYRALTIEVDVKRRVVCQVKGERNAPPKRRAYEVLEIRTPLEEFEGYVRARIDTLSRLGETEKAELAAKALEVGRRALARVTGVAPATQEKSS